MFCIILELMNSKMGLVMRPFLLVLKLTAFKSAVVTKSGNSAAVYVSFALPRENVGGGGG